MKKVLSKMGSIFAVVLMTVMMMSAVVTAENKASGIDKQVVEASININTATVKELSNLSGIGKKKAEAIIAYRKNNGSFSDVNDLKKVEGIGKKTFEKIMNKIAVN